MLWDKNAVANGNKGERNLFEVLFNAGKVSWLQFCSSAWIEL